jgi:hypothetical protein
MTDLLKHLKPGWNEIARQQVDGMAWNQTGKISLKAARQLYDAGVVEMVTRRERITLHGVDKPGAEFVLQIRPRKKPDAERSPYFGAWRG